MDCPRGELQMRSHLLSAAEADGIGTDFAYCLYDSECLNLPEVWKSVLRPESDRLGIAFEGRNIRKTVTRLQVGDMP